MKIKFLHLLAFVCIIPLVSCSQDKAPTKKIKKPSVQEPHRYGGWYCPDNLFGFPAVDIQDWKNVPVVNGRMATKEEAQNGTSLIHVDIAKYPNAKPLDMTMPKLARYYCQNSGKEEIVIIIQALNISNDSIVGFRYLNGGNGSARLSEVTILADDEIEALTPGRFVNFSVFINTKTDKVFEVVTQSKYNKSLQPIFDKNKTLKSDWRENSKINFMYPKDLEYSSEFAGKLFGNNYIQIDRKAGDYNYVEKFFFTEDKLTKATKLTIVCGPYVNDYESQKSILSKWAQKVKELSE